MYLFPVSVKRSPIEGEGVFAEEDILKGSIVWKFDPNHDLSVPPEQADQFDEKAKADLRKVGYVFDLSISPEPFFVARVDIRAGEEITVNYVEFDDSIKKGRPEWMNMGTVRGSGLTSI